MARYNLLYLVRVDWIFPHKRCWRQDCFRGGRDSPWCTQNLTEHLQSASSPSCSARGDHARSSRSSRGRCCLSVHTQGQCLPPLAWPRAPGGRYRAPSGAGYRFCPELWVLAPLFLSLPFHCAWLVVPLATGQSYFSWVTLTHFTSFLFFCFGPFLIQLCLHGLA